MPGLYSAGLCISQSGVISGIDLTAEASITKLMHLLGSGYNTETVKRMMMESLCGELSNPDDDRTHHTCSIASMRK